MTPRSRKVVLTVHIVASVGWLGAAGAYLALALAGIDNLSAMLIVGWRAAVPFGVLSFASGLLQAIGSEWGLIRYYWILVKLGLTVFGLAILLGHMNDAANRAIEQHVVHSSGGLAVLLAATVLSVFKPWGRTPFASRRTRSV